MRASQAALMAALLAASGGVGAQDVTDLAGFTEAMMLDLVPTLQRPEACTGVKYSPAIDYTQSGHAAPGDAAIWTWDVSSPHQLTETHSGTVFPSPAFQTEVRTVQSGVGTATTLKFTYTMGHFPETAAVVTLDLCLAYQHTSYMLVKPAGGLLAQLRNAYDGTTATEAYAYRILVLLDRWAHNWNSYIY